MNILTICEGGNNRSAALSTVLKTEFYHNAINVGTMYALSDQFNRQPGWMLCAWAERIVFMAAEITNKDLIPQEHWPKIRICEVGKDLYGTPKHPELMQKCRDWIVAGGLQ